jgi:hypothetical protein
VVIRLDKLLLSYFVRRRRCGAMNASGGDHPYAAAYHGLAAIGMAGVLLLMAVPALQLAHWLDMYGYRGWPPSDRRLAIYGGYAGAALAELLCWVSVVFAVRGLAAARRTGESGVLCVAGLLLGLFAAALWVMCGVAWHIHSWWFIRNA